MKTIKAALIAMIVLCAFAGAKAQTRIVTTRTTIVHAPVRHYSRPVVVHRAPVRHVVYRKPVVYQRPVYYRPHQVVRVVEHRRY